MSRNIFWVIWKFWINSIFWVILESLLQLKRFLDHFKSWNYPFLCVWWGNKSFVLMKVPEVCFPGGGSSSPPSCQMHQKKLMSNRVNNKSNNEYFRLVTFRDKTLLKLEILIKHWLMFNHDLIHFKLHFHGKQGNSIFKQ